MAVRGGGGVGLAAGGRGAAAPVPDPIPPAPPARAAAPERPSFLAAVRTGPAERPPEASAKTREQKRFGCADKDDDGRITRTEMLEPRRKAFAKLDANADRRLAFEEWATRTTTKLADDDGNGALTAVGYATTALKRRAEPACCC